MITRHPYLTLILYFLLATFSSFSLLEKNLAWAIEPQIEISPQQGTTSDIFLMTVRVPGGFNQINPPNFASNKNFSISPLGQSSQTTYVNGELSSNIAFSFQVLPSSKLPPGKYQLPDGLINLNGNPIALKKPIIRIISEEEGSAKSDSNRIKFSQKVSKVDPYIGEQIIYTAEVYAPEAARKLELDPENFAGFWTESFGRQRVSVKAVGWGGNKIHREKHALFPLSTGKLSIPERGLTAAILMRPTGASRNSLSPWGDWFNQGSSRFRSLKLTGKATHIKAKPLPKHPKSYSGYVPVGTIKVSSEFKSSSIKTGESLLIRLTVTGDANLRALKLPEPKGVDKKKFRFYENSSKTNSWVEQGRVWLEKSYDIEFIPLVPGTWQLPNFEIISFDPTQEQYQEQSSDFGKIVVTPGTKDGAGSIVSKNLETNSQKEPANIEQQLPAEKSSLDGLQPLVASISPRIIIPSPGKTVLLVLLALAPLCSLFKIYFAHTKAKLKTDTSTKLLDRTLARLNSAKNDSIEELDQTLAEYFQSQLKVSNSAKEIINAVEEKIPARDNSKLILLIKELEEAKFSVKKTPDNISELSKLAIKEIKSLHRSLPKW